MRFHLRFPEDDWVDRPELEAQQCVEATGTNTPNKPTPGFSTNHTTQSNTVRVHYAVTDTTHPMSRELNTVHDTWTLYEPL